MKVADTQQGLQPITIPVIVSANKDVNKELSLWVLETQIDLQAARTPVKATWCGLETRLAGVHSQAELGSNRATGMGVCSHPSLTDQDLGKSSDCNSRPRLNRTAGHSKKAT